MYLLKALNRPAENKPVDLAFLDRATCSFPPNIYQVPPVRAFPTLRFGQCSLAPPLSSSPFSGSDSAAGPRFPRGHSLHSLSHTLGLPWVTELPEDLSDGFREGWELRKEVEESSFLLEISYFSYFLFSTENGLFFSDHKCSIKDLLKNQENSQTHTLTLVCQKAQWPKFWFLTSGI